MRTHVKGSSAMGVTGSVGGSGFRVVRESKQNVQDSFGEAPRPLVVYIRGNKAQSVAAALDQFSAALQFPWYFGDNLDAFSECIRDLNWLWPFSRITLVIFDAELFLSQESRAKTHGFVDILADAIQYWAVDAGDAGRTSTEPITMEVLLQLEPDDYRADTLVRLGL